MMIIITALILTLLGAKVAKNAINRYNDNFVCLVYTIYFIVVWVTVINLISEPC